jgi:hypothetical protein
MKERVADSVFELYSACFNRLDLPLGISRGELKRMLYAVLDTELYGFTTD